MARRCPAFASRECAPFGGLPGLFPCTVVACVCVCGGLFVCFVCLCVHVCLSVCLVFVCERCMLRVPSTCVCVSVPARLTHILSERHVPRESNQSAHVERGALRPTPPETSHLLWMAVWDRSKQRSCAHFLCWNWLSTPSTSCDSSGLACDCQCACAHTFKTHHESLSYSW